MSGLAKFLPHGANVLRKTVTMSSAEIKSKYVFFYFSAGWCPPCRGFTPQLIEFYEKFHESKDFEIIFISWDEEKEGFDGYYGKMPWLALPFENRKGMEHLTNGFNVQSIPTLIGVEGATGKIVTTTARNMVVKDPEGKNFPWPDQPGSKQ